MRHSAHGLSALMVVAIGTSLGCGPDEQPHTEVVGPRVEEFVQAVMERFEVPGLTLAAVRDGEVVYAGAFGVRNLETGKPMTPECLFHFASVSKPFVATAVVRLAEQGKLDLDAPVTQYLPYFRLDDPRHSEITVRQMLNHTSGMSDVADYGWDSPEVDEGAAERYVRSLVSEKMIAAPGERMQYSNMAFDTLGDVIAKVSGMPFEAYVERHILDPLGMEESTFIYPETRPALRTSPHVWDQGPSPSEVYPYNRRHAPSSTLNSSVVEMTRWILANLGHGELDGTRILSPESHDLMWTRSVERDDGPSVGLSWFLGRHRGERLVTHSGGDLGYVSDLVMLPDRGLGVVAACNYDQMPIGSVSRGVLDILLGHEPVLPKLPVARAFARVLEEEGIDAARAEYRRLQAEEADSYAFGPGQLNRLGYSYLLRRDDTRTAIEVLRFNAELFPDEANCFDSLGDAYHAAGELDLAIESYRQALVIDPDFAAARRNLEDLGAPVAPVASEL